MGIEEKTTINRRAFLTGAAATGALAAASAMFGCAPAAQPSEADAAGTGAAPSIGTVDGYSSVIDWLGSKP